MTAAITAAVVGGLIAGGASVYSSRQQAKATRQAANLQKRASDDALRQQTQETNQASQRSADEESLLEQNTGSDTQSTMLTGPNGLTLDDLILGRGTSLLGGRR